MNGTAALSHPPAPGNQLQVANCTLANNLSCGSKITPFVPWSVVIAVSVCLVIFFTLVVVMTCLVWRQNPRRNRAGNAAGGSSRTDPEQPGVKERPEHGIPMMTRPGVLVDMPNDSVAVAVLVELRGSPAVSLEDYNVATITDLSCMGALQPDGPQPSHSQLSTSPAVTPADTYLPIPLQCTQK
eukprot:jgi/Botrbrau1/14619/Bobra.0364s0003.1